MRKVDLDKLSTWVEYKPSMCKGCMGYCCSLPVDASVSDLVRMELLTADEALWSARKIARKLQKQGVVVSFRASKMLFQLTQKANRECLYLGEDRLCKIYDKRPDVCRRFPSCSPRVNYCPAVKISDAKKSTLKGR